MEKYRAAREEILNSCASDNNFCVPLAVALVSGRSAAEVNNILIARGLRKRNKGMNLGRGLDLLKETGLDYKNVTKLYCPGKTTVSVKSIVKLLDPLKKYVVGVNSHCCAVVHGVVEDWSAQRMHRVNRIYEIIDPTSTVVSNHVIKPVQPRNPLAQTELAAEILALLNTDTIRYYDRFSAKATGSWIKFSICHRDFSFLLSKTKTGDYKFALVGDTRYFMADDINALVSAPRNESKSYAHWILTQAEVVTAAEALRDS